MFQILTPKKLDVALIARGLAAASVVWWHTGGYAVSTTTGSLLTIPGRTAVWLFFTLSGYLMAYGFLYGKYNFDGPSLRKFFFNRWIRIYPLFAIVLIASYASHRAVGLPIPITWRLIFRELFHLQWVHDYTLNSVFWTLGVEVIFYLAVPCLVWTQAKWCDVHIGATIAYGGLLLATISFTSLVPVYGGDYRDLFGNLVHFQCGIMACAWRRHILKLKSRHFEWLLPIAAGLFLVFSNRIYHTNSTDYFFRDGIVLVNGLGFSVLSIHMLTEAKTITELTPVWKILHSLGALSYGSYAWHGALIIFPILAGNFLATFLLTYLLAYTTYILVERPIQRWRNLQR